MKEVIFWAAVVIFGCFVIGATNNYLTGNYRTKTYSETMSEGCVEAFGKEYFFVYGQRSPSFCTDNNGNVKYFK